jgi:hypothetical protein
MLIIRSYLKMKTPGERFSAASLDDLPVKEASRSMEAEAALCRRTGLFHNASTICGD